MLSLLSFLIRRPSAIAPASPCIDPDRWDEEMLIAAFHGFGPCGPASYLSLRRISPPSSLSRPEGDRS